MAKKWRNKMWNDSDVITLLVDSNPKAPGSASYERFKHYRNGMTVGEYKNIVGATKQVKSGIYYIAAADLRNDTEHKYINVTPSDRLPKNGDVRMAVRYEFGSNPKVKPNVYNAKDLWDTLGGPSTSDSMKLKIVMQLLKPEEIGRLVKDLQRAW